jgi:hypothetical protein
VWPTSPHLTLNGAADRSQPASLSRGAAARPKVFRLPLLGPSLPPRRWPPEEGKGTLRGNALLHSFKSIAGATLWSRLRNSATLRMGAACRNVLISPGKQRNRPCERNEGERVYFAI